MKWIIALVTLYVIGFLFTLLAHMISFQMITLPLALMRSAVWPIWMATGWPHGVPLRMD